MHGTNTFRLAEHVSRKASGRKPTRKATATRQKILDAAAEIFAKRGYSLTRLSDIAESAGVHLTALYYYYDSKEALVADIISFVPTRTLLALQRALNALPRSVRHQRRIETAFDVYLDSILKDDDYVRADHRIAAQISPQVRKRAVAISRRINAIWRKLLDEAVAAGELRADIDTTMLRMLMIGSMNWAVEWFRPEDSPPQRLADALKQLFFDGVRPQVARPARAPRGSSTRSARSKRRTGRSHTQ